jgi:hypothetical protein
MRRESFRQDLLVRFNASFTKCLLALWPEENKAWGMAFAAESVAIDSPQKQFRWLLGGIPVLLRENFKSFLSSLGRPIGVSPADVLGGSVAPQGRTPKMPRIVLALLLVFFVALFAQPATRAVFRSVSESYTERGWDPSNWSEVRRIQSLAEKNLSEKTPDPQLLAFASLLFEDEAKRLSFSDAAIKLEPGLTWIDSQNVVLPWNDTTNQHPLSADRIDRLFSADPENAMLYLLRAESIAVTYRQQDAQNDPGAHQIASWGSQVSNDPRWLAAMDAAFRAPRYDAYDRNLFQLSRDVIERYSVNDPRIFSAMLGRRPINQYRAINTYAKILLSRASDAQRAGVTDSAIQDCSLLLNFAQRLRTGNFYQVEKWIANDIESLAYPVLQALYETSGRHQQALEIAAFSQQNREERLKHFAGTRFRSSTFPHWSGVEWRALFMQSSVFSIWILLPASLASITLLWFLRSRLHVTRGIFHSLLCLFADFCPAILAFASAILFVAYAPVDAAYRQVVRGPFSPSTYQDFTHLVYAPFSLPGSVVANLGVVSGPYGRFLLWSAVTAVLILLVLVLFVRQMRRRAESE